MINRAIGTIMTKCLQMSERKALVNLKGTQLREAAEKQARFNIYQNRLSNNFDVLSKSATCPHDK